MTAKLSDGMRNHMLETGSVKGAFATLVMRIYSGTEPVSANDAITGTLLVTLTGPSAAALAFDAAVGGALPKASSQVWSGVAVAGGTATHFRLTDTADTGNASTTAKRIQGKCGTSTSELNMTSTSIASGATQTVDAGNITMPAA
ncbi:hypothetical protein [Variovorax sp. RCC_210]|uniref:hypothetical protein n=1 Tax=Variovorax sp. RCC_210 TaxID=3239217 RepID=UPI0035242C2B